MTEDWQTDKTVTECNKYMLHNEVFTDVTFLVSNSICLNVGDNIENDLDTDSVSPPVKKVKLSETCASIASVSHTRRRTTRQSTASSHNTSKGTGPPAKDHIQAPTPIVSIPAHKYMLVSRSPVFYAMFAGPLAERGEVRVEDVDPQAFREMLNFLYTEDVDLTLDNVKFVLYAARKYIIPKLIRKCEEFIASKLTAQNACILLNYFINSTEENIVQQCSNLIMLQAKNAFSSESSCKIGINTLEHILDFKLLSVKEIELFRFMIKWAEAECSRRNKAFGRKNVRDILGDNVLKINYTKFTHTEVADIVVPWKILDSDTIQDIFTYLCSSLEMNPPIKISHLDRYVDTHKKFCSTHLDRGSRSIKVMRDCSFSMSFDVNTPFRLYGFVLHFKEWHKSSLVAWYLDDEGIHKLSLLPHNRESSKVQLRLPKGGLELGVGTSTVMIELSVRKKTIDPMQLYFFSQTTHPITATGNKHVVATMDIDSLNIDGVEIFPPALESPARSALFRFDPSLCRLESDSDSSEVVDSDDMSFRM